MKQRMIAVVFSAAMACATVALAEMAATHKVVMPQDIQWGAAPASLPAGAEAAVLDGDPTKSGMFALRIKVPKGYRIAPHTHPEPEAITVISGKFGLGMGAKEDRAGVKHLTTGSFASMPAGMPHYVIVDEDSIVQLNAMGPWGIDYLDPKDDPRLNIAPSR